MPNAYTWTRGNEIKEFSTRAQLYDYMVEVGDIILEGDDAVLFRNHCEKRNRDHQDQAGEHLLQLRQEEV